MRSLAKTLIAGTLLATGSLCAGATSAQTYAAEVWARAENRQVQTAPVIAETELLVVDPQSVGVQVGASGNAYGTGADGVSLIVDSDQRVSGDVEGTSYTQVTGTAFTASVNSTASGNASSAIVYGGNLRGTVDQVVEQGALINADSRLVQGPTGALGDVGVTTTSVANNQSYGVTGGWAETRTDQTSGASVIADGSGLVNRITGQGSFVSTAVGNNLTSAVDQGSGSVSATQTQTGEYVLGATFLTTPWAQSATVVSTASGNNVVATSAYGPMEVELTQDNASYVRSQTGSGIAEYGSVTTTAAGVGNAVIASNLGAETRFDVSQTTSGGVDVSADFTGGYGYDSITQATAHGNSIMGAACSDCTSNFEARSHQVNDSDVNARAAANITGAARSANVNANAVGNSASYYVQRPGY